MLTGICNICRSIGCSPTRRLVKTRNGHNWSPCEVVLLVKCDGVVRALARMHAAGRDGEPEARVGVNALLEIGDADHDVVNAR